MLKIPEYHSLCVDNLTLETVTISVKIDGSARVIPSRQMNAHVVARLLEAFLIGELAYMSFDEHARRLIGISTTRDIKPMRVTFSARTLTRADNFPKNWDIADPVIYGAAPWNGQMR